MWVWWDHLTRIQEDPGNNIDDCRDDHLGLLTMAVSKESSRRERRDTNLWYEVLLSAVLTRLTLTLGVEPVRLVQSHAKLTAGSQRMPLCHLALLSSEKRLLGWRYREPVSAVETRVCCAGIDGCFEIQGRFAHDWLPLHKLHLAAEVSNLRLG
jgi:hypothetical protein